jgi:alkylated DNA repair protein (DNA oxidative demethylase)
LSRSSRPRRIPLDSGDVVVWRGPARLVYHGVMPLDEGEHSLTGPRRLNLTLRKAL